MALDYTWVACSSNPGVGEIFFLSLALFCFTLLLLARLSNHLKSEQTRRFLFQNIECLAFLHLVSLEHLENVIIIVSD